MTVDTTDAALRATVLAEALPYIRKFHGDTIVIKLGGSSLEEAKANVLEDVVLLRYVGMNPVVVHGGGPEITAWQQKIGIEPLRGRPAGDRRAVDGGRQDGPHRQGQPRAGGGDQRPWRAGRGAVRGRMVQPSLVAPCRGAGRDPGLCRRGRPGQPRAAGRTAGTAATSPSSPPSGLGYDGKSYNVNADTVAAELAVALGARKLILLTDVEGVKDAGGKLVSEVVAHDVEGMIEGGIITAGMIPKVRACVRALSGCEKAHIIDGRVPHALLLELLTEAGIGTMIVPG